MKTNPKLIFLLQCLNTPGYGSIVYISNLPPVDLLLITHIQTQPGSLDKHADIINAI